jgi:hypothetical protein
MHIIIKDNKWSDNEKSHQQPIRWKEEIWDW